MDATPGTTADTKVVLMELHEVGPAKLFDTGQPGRLLLWGGGRCLLLHLGLWAGATLQAG